MDVEGGSTVTLLSHPCGAITLARPATYALVSVVLRSEYVLVTQLRNVAICLLCCHNAIALLLQYAFQNLYPYPACPLRPNDDGGCECPVVILLVDKLYYF